MAAIASAVFGLIQYLDLDTAFAPWINATVPGEAFANLRQRNQFASLTNIGLVALLFLTSRKLPKSSQVGNLATMFLAALLAVGNAASTSRTGLIQLGLVIFLAAMWGAVRQPVVLRILFTSILVYAVAAVALPLLLGLDFKVSGILGRFQEEGLACSSRLTLWSNVAHLVAQKPWLGWGWGELDYAHFITLYPGMRFCEIADNAHNLPLHLAVELGVPVALLSCSALAWLVWRARPWLERDGSRQMAWAVLALIVLHSLLEYPLWYGPFQIAVGLCIWILISVPSSSDGLAQTAGQNLPHSDIVQTVVSPTLARFVKCAAVVVLAGVGCVAWDYYRISQIYLPSHQRAEAYQHDTLAKIQDSWFFQNQVQFAQLTLTPVTPHNAAQINDLANKLVHFSPEARVVEKIIDSASLLGRDADAAYYGERYAAAFPSLYAKWAAAKGSAGLPSK